MKKFFIFILLISTFNMKINANEISDEVYGVRWELRQDRFKYVNSKVKVIVSKDVTEYAKLIEEFCSNPDVYVTNIWNNYNADKKQYEAIIYYNIDKK